MSKLTPDPARMNATAESVVGDDRLAIDLVRGVHPRTLRALLDRFGTARALLDADVDLIMAGSGRSRTFASGLRRALGAAADRVELERNLLARRGARLVGLGAPDYPALLAMTPGPPPVLRVRGGPGSGIPICPEWSVAVVGSRRPTGYGRRQARRFAAGLLDHGVHLVSGGARGIDGEVHRLAVDRGRGTTAVLGSGLDRPYPPEHSSLFDAIVDSGGVVVSQFPMDTPPRPANFPRRNLTVAGLALGVLVVEAAVRSGALITARLAVEELGRECGAVPGRLEDRRSEGCHRIIAEGWGGLVRTPAELVEMISGNFLGHRALQVR